VLPPRLGAVTEFGVLQPHAEANAELVQYDIRFYWHYGCHKQKGGKEKESPAASLGRSFVK
jgi:hypothetical protein